MSFDPAGRRAIAQFGLTGPPVPTAPANPTAPAAYGYTLWLYETQDTHIQAEASGYFADGGSAGMRVGDIVLVSSSAPNGGGVTVHVVTNVVPPPANLANIAPPGAASIGSASGAQNSVATGLIATGATQGTALALAADINMFATVAVGTGAILPTLNPSDVSTVFNGGANALLLYPPLGGKINNLAANAGYSIAVATPLVEVTCVSATQYLARQSA
jgi:hypothetical protein